MSSFPVAIVKVGADRVGVRPAIVTKRPRMDQPVAPERSCQTTRNWFPLERATRGARESSVYWFVTNALQ